MKTECPRCGAKDKTETTLFKSGSVYVNTNCDKCSYNYGRLDMGYDNKPMQGEWSRHNTTERNEFAKDILQPIKKDGTINKHFVEAHGTKALQKELKLKPRQIRENIEKYG